MKRDHQSYLINYDAEFRNRIIFVPGNAYEERTDALSASWML